MIVNLYGFNEDILLFLYFRRGIELAAGTAIVRWSSVDEASAWERDGSGRGSLFYFLYSLSSR